MGADGRCGRLLFIGLHDTPDEQALTGQGYHVVHAFLRSGLAVRSACATVRPVSRLLHQLALVWRHKRWADCVVIESPAGPFPWNPLLVAAAARLVEVPSILVLRDGERSDRLPSPPRRFERALLLASRVASPSADLRMAVEGRGLFVTELPESGSHVGTGGPAMDGGGSATQPGSSDIATDWRALLESVGVPMALTTREGCGPLRLLDLADVTRIHGEAFPDSALTRLGPSVVHRYYLWQFTGPHPVPTALGCWRDGELVGFLFGGHRRGAVSGFVRRYPMAIALAAIRRPRSVRKVALPKVAAVARSVVRRPISVTGSTADADGGADGPDRGAEMPERSNDYGASFGVLAIAVSGAAQGTGAGARLMASATELAAARGFARMHLTVQTGNRHAIRFYEKLGWDRVPDGDTWEGAMASSIPGSIPLGDIR